MHSLGRTVGKQLINTAKNRWHYIDYSPSSGHFVHFWKIQLVTLALWMSRDPSYLLLIGWKLLQSSWSLIGRKMSSQGCSQAQFSQLTADSKGKKRQLRSTGSPHFTLLHKIGTLQGVPYLKFSTGIMNSVCKKCNKKMKKVSFYFSKFLNVCLSQTHSQKVWPPILSLKFF